VERLNIKLRLIAALWQAPATSQPAPLFVLIRGKRKQL